MADAQERENRIRQEMEARKEEARTLAQRLSNSGAPAVATSFFQSVQRKGTTSITAVDISDVCDVSLPHVVSSRFRHMPKC